MFTNSLFLGRHARVGAKAVVDFGVTPPNDHQISIARLTLLHKLLFKRYTKV